MLDYIQTKSNQKPQNIIIFLHGYGANGKDLISLEKHFRENLPDLHAVSPNAPHKTGAYPDSYYWFELASFDSDYLEQQVENTLPLLDEFINQVLAKHNLKKQNLTLCGFSQGSILAITYGLTSKQSLKAVLSFSGGALPNIATKIKNKTPICLVHGSDDQVLPDEYSKQTYQNLKSLNHPVQLKIINNLGHTINNEVINFANNFLKDLQK